MKKSIFIFYTISAILLCACEKHRDGVKDGAAKITFSPSDQDTKSFINQINMSGNELVVFDYVTDINRDESEDINRDESEFYIRHKRIRCTVDGQIEWDYVDNDEFYWIYGTHGTHHKCFAWLYSGPGGNNTIDFFKEHPHLDIDDDQENHVLHLPIYNFDLNSPIYDFLYSDIVTRKYTQENPDSSPVNLTMNHLFSAFRFSITNMQLNPIKIDSVSLHVYTEKQTTIDFRSVEDGVKVKYSEKRRQPIKHKSSFSLNTGDSNYLFTDSDEYEYHMIWAQTEDEFNDASLVIYYKRQDANGDYITKVEEIKLNEFNYREWKNGQQYTYDIFFTEKEIKLDCSVVKWERQERPLDYTAVVLVSDKMHWNQDTIELEDEHEGYVVIDNDKAAECYFEIDAPKGATWTATFLRLDGNDNAFKFVDPNSADPSNPDLKDYISGDVGFPATLKIVPVVKETFTTNRAKLRVVVKVGDRTIVVENLCMGHDFHEYTIVQNQNKFE